MTLTLHYHPLSSYCWKALLALYESGEPFTPNLVDLQDAAQRAAFLALWPIGKFPVLVDDAEGLVIPESSIIAEYLAERGAQLIPPECARDVRARDRFYDLYVHNPMQDIVGDRLRSPQQRDAFGVAAAKARIETAYGMVEDWMRPRHWGVGDSFTLADCAAFPALFYANKVVPIGDARPSVRAYLARLAERPSVARVLAEAEPYFKLFPA